MLPQEHAGKHPCIVNRRGDVLWFADEDKAGLKAKGSKKRSARKKTDAEPGSSDAMSDASDSDEPSARRRRKKKRAYDSSGDEAMTLIEDGDVPRGQSDFVPPARRPVPTRIRPSAPPREHEQTIFARQHGPPIPNATRPSAPPTDLGIRPGYPSYPPIPNATRPSAPPPDLGIQPGYPSYPPPFPPHGYPQAPPYGHAGSYTNQVYPPSFYQQGYPPWQPNPAPQQGPNWQGPPAPLTPEEQEQLMIMRARQI